MKNKRQMFEHIYDKSKKILGSTKSKQEVLKGITELLHKEVDYYDWVGFYLSSNHEEKTLILDAYVGEPTEHTKIAYGQGICGQSAETGKTFVVQDVSEEGNYLSCSINVKSEIVVPILKDGVFVGELDIDSHTASPFTEEDEVYLSKICEGLSKLF